ncbi:MAG TPA: hypothetical protein VJ550_08760 [Geomonas sp.]|nr:hypothetical protein [Geomonas sp.]
MSLILDALRKMEQDRKNRRGAGGDLRPEVLRYRGEVTSHSAKPYLMAAAGAVLLIVGVGAGFLIRGQGGGQSLQSGRDLSAAPQTAADQSSAPPATVAAAPVAPGYPGTAESPAAQLPAASAPPAAVAQTAALPAAGPAAGAQAQAVAVPRVPEAVAPHPASGQSRAERPAASASLPGEAPAAGAQTVKAKKGRSKAAASAQGLPNSEKQARRMRQEAQQPVPTGAADIALSGIAWQDERNLRRAVLNGSLVGEGAMVSGARVVEIQETRVRMSRNGRLFDLALSSALAR